MVNPQPVQEWSAVLTRKGRPAASAPPRPSHTTGTCVMTSIDQRIAQELGVRELQVTAAVALLDGGATVPFIARYRKEATGALVDGQLRTLDERLRYLRELEERREVILKSIRGQGKLDAALEAAIRAADSKGRLEDIDLPLKPSATPRPRFAKEAGLAPLADLRRDSWEGTSTISGRIHRVRPDAHRSVRLACLTPRICSSYPGVVRT
jgi:uncharacterized protein